MCIEYIEYIEICTAVSFGLSSRSRVLARAEGPAFYPLSPNHRFGGVWGDPVKRWAIIFRARGARVVPVLPSTRIPSREKQVPPLGLKSSIGMIIWGRVHNMGQNKTSVAIRLRSGLADDFGPMSVQTHGARLKLESLTRESRLAGRKSLAQRLQRWVGIVINPSPVGTTEDQTLRCSLSSLRDSGLLHNAFPALKGWAKLFRARGARAVPVPLSN